jgi:glycosyltransferase involved in cell wall biosynthesis
MEIVIELTEALRRYRGWGRYNLELTKALLSIDERSRYQLFYHRDPAEPEPELDPSFHRPNVTLTPVVMPRAAYDALEEGRGASFLDEQFPQAAVYHAVTEFPFHVRRMRKVVTIHELSPLFFPKLFPPSRIHYFRHYIEENIRLADVLVAVSEATRRDLVETFHLPEERVVCVPNGVSEIFFEGDRWDPATEPYLLYVGSVLDPLKNVASLLHGFARAPLDHRLVLVTNELDKPTLVQRFSLSEKVASRVEIVGAVSDQRLKRFYEKASLFVFPSIHEGFGLPVAEAMAVGCPVLVGENSSLTEVTGGFCATFSESEAHALEGAIVRAVERYPFSRVAEGRAYVRERFRWERVARQMLSLYQRLAEIPGSSSPCKLKESRSLRQ